MTKETKQDEIKEQPKNTDVVIDDTTKALIDAFNERIDAIEQKHQEELKAIREEQKTETRKILQTIISGHQQQITPETKDVEDDAEDDEDDDSLKAIENKTRKDLLIKFGLIKNK